MPVRKDAAALLAAGDRDTALTDAACLVFMGTTVHASNGQLVERAIEIIERLGGRALTPAEGREKMKLKRRG